MQTVGFGKPVVKTGLKQANEKLTYTIEDLFAVYQESGEIPEKKQLLKDFCQCAAFLPNGSLVVNRTDGCKIVTVREMKREFESLGAMVYYDASPIHVTVEDFIKKNKRYIRMLE
jgi:hypothetical protein